MASPAESAIHRPSEVARLERLLNSTERGLSICSISGPGGVGKTYLLEHALAANDLKALGYLGLAADAANPQTRSDFFAIVEGQLAPRRLAIAGDLSRDYFPQTREVAALYRDLVQEALTELKAKTAPEEVKRVIIAFLKAARCLNATIPQSRDFLDIDATGLDEAKVEKTLDATWEALSELQSLRESTALPGPLRDLFGITLKNRVKRDLFQATADALLSDLSAAIVGYLSRDWFKLTHGPIPGVKRLLLVIDDYEAVAPLLRDFLVGALVPRLAEAAFPTLLVILGRDDLEATHVGWGQHCKQYLHDRIRLQPFDRAVALDLLGQAGISGSRADVIYAATQGVPFLLTLAIEEARDEDADAALFLKRFFDRTTRWMNPRQRKWFIHICYLDVVNEDTLARLYPLAEVPEIQDWFETEASIRDPIHSTFRVRPFIRDKVLRYLELRSPSRHEGMLCRARGEAAA